MKLGVGRYYVVWLFPLLPCAETRAALGSCKARKIPKGKSKNKREEQDGEVARELIQS